jgi:Protein of unknown function (DUF1018)
MATPTQIKKIHVLKSDLKLDDGEYRSMLESYVSPEGIPIWSSKDLSYDQASSLIRSMELVIDRTPMLKARVYASPKQLRFIIALWRHITRAADEDGVNKTLHSFLNKRFHIRRLDKISKKQMAKVIKSLRIMTSRSRSQNTRSESSS